MTAPSIMTEQGPVVGVADYGVDSYLGIPFGEASRFTRARKPAARKHILAATSFGPGPAQPPAPWLPDGLNVSEDCLTLNVWSPRSSANRGRNLPVFVWIFGGGFQNGLSGLDSIRGNTLALTGDMVVVTINYRVGALGFASLTHLGQPYQEASNLGLTDVVQALEWVAANIASFGGDPQQVTVAGGSAGAFLAGALPATPSAAGLYQRLALFSGGASRLVPAPQAKQIGSALADLLPSGDLINAPLQDLFAAQQKVIAKDIGARNGVRPQAFGVVLDDTEPSGVLSSHPSQAYESPEALDIDVWSTAAADEISPFRDADPHFDPASKNDLIAHRDEWDVDADTAERLVTSYLLETTNAGEARERLLTDWIYRLPAARLVEAHTRAGGQSFLSLIESTRSGPAVHGCETSGVFARPLETETDEERRRGAEITQAVIAFAHTGNPGWQTGVDSARTFGDSATGAGETYRTILRRWTGIARP